MKKENFLETTIPATGSYDEGFELVKNLSEEVDYPELEKAFTRENLLAAYERGEKGVLRIVKQHDDNGVFHRIAIEDYFMENPDSDDVFMVSFMHRVDFSEETYLTDARNPINSGTKWNR